MPAFGEEIGDEMDTDTPTEEAFYDQPLVQNSAATLTRTGSVAKRHDSSVSPRPAAASSSSSSSSSTATTPRDTKTKQFPRGNNDEESSSDGELDDEEYQQRLKKLQQEAAGSPPASDANPVKRQKKRTRGVSVLNEDVQKEFSTAVELARGQQTADAPLSPQSPHQPQPQPQQQPQSPPGGVAGGLQDVRLAPPDSLDHLSPEEKKKVIFRRLCIANQGVIYEDEILQVGFKSEYQHGQGRMMLFFGNKTQHAFSSFVIVVPPMGFLAMQTQQQVMPIIDPATQQKFLITMMAQTAFSDSYPQITISFMCVSFSI